MMHPDDSFSSGTHESEIELCYLYGEHGYHYLMVPCVFHYEIETSATNGRSYLELTGIEINGKLDELLFLNLEEADKEAFEDEIERSLKDVSP